jgi:SPP1 gp7 family putative phage head morphogenesis protein
MHKRFLKIRGMIRKAIVVEDVFGLVNQPVVLQTPGHKAYQFRTSAQKVEAFMAWLRQEVQKEILQLTVIQQLGSASNQAWTNLYIRDSYARGVAHARFQLKKAGFNVPTIAETGGIYAAMGGPLHTDRLGLLYSRTFTDLRGITEAMDTHVSRVLAQGIADGDNPRVLAKTLNATIKKGGAELGINDILGRYIPAERRAEMLARTEVIRAHAEAQLQEYKNWGVAEVHVMAEWITAGDNRVCDRCANMEGSRFTIEQASGMIPLHPQCRCAWLPYNKTIT